jgi:hypothetical protein
MKNDELPKDVQDYDQGKLSEKKFVSMKIAIFVAAVLLALGINAAKGRSEPSLAKRSTSAARAVEEVAHFKVAATNGYSAWVTISNGRASVLLSKGHTAALYGTDRSVTSQDSYNASFRGLGKVMVRFHPRPGSAYSCRDELFERPGWFTGRIRFRGERNYTRVSGARVNGAVSVRSCGKKASTNQSKKTQSAKFEVKSLTVGKREGIEFRAGLDALKEVYAWESVVGIPLGLSSIDAFPVAFSAVSVGLEQGVKVVRIAVAGGSDRTFEVSSDQYARVAPGMPFTGAGVMDGCRPSSWQGNLKVRFPGREIRLAGSRSLATFESALLKC